MIEDALRETFDARAAHAPVLDDIAGRAIRGAVGPGAGGPRC
jgi:hypothetical protein